jgi:hypothetical protein
MVINVWRWWERVCGDVLFSGLRKSLMDPGGRYPEAPLSKDDFVDWDKKRRLVCPNSPTPSLKRHD